MADARPSDAVPNITHARIFFNIYVNTTRNGTRNVTDLQPEVSIHITRFLNAMPWLLIILSISILVSNSVVLAAFAKNPNLRTPFNMYLISLILADMAQGIFDLPLTVVSKFIPVWPLGHIGCNFNLYGKWVFTAAVRNTHALISINRIWALLFPISYKEYHTKTVAIWLCVGSWVYVHIFLLPGLVPDALYYRIDDGSCLVNTTANYAWALPTQMLLYNSTLVVILLTYPVIWWKIRKRRRTTPCHIPRTGVGLSISRASRMASEDYKLQVKVNDAFEALPPSEVNISKAAEIKYEDSDHDHENHPEHSNTNNNHARSKAAPKKSQSFAVLTYLVVGVVVCWTPIMVFFTISILNPDYDDFLYFLIGSLLYYLNSLLDPIFFSMAITPLRVTISTFFSKRKKKPVNLIKGT